MPGSTSSRRNKIHELIDQAARLCAEPARLVTGRCFGNDPHDRLGVASTNEQPTVVPIQTQTIETTGRRLGKRRFQRRKCRWDGFPVESHLHFLDGITRQFVRQLAERKFARRHIGLVTAASVARGVGSVSSSATSESEPQAPRTAAADVTTSSEMRVRR